MSLMKNVEVLAAEVRGRMPALNILVLSSGFANLKAPQNTAEGINDQLAVQWYSRFYLTKLLVPSLEAGAAAGGPASVTFIFNSGKVPWVRMDSKPNPNPSP